MENASVTFTKRFVFDALPEADTAEMTKAAEILDRLMRERWAVLEHAFMAAALPPSIGYTFSWEGLHDGKSAIPIITPITAAQLYATPGV